MRILLIIGLLLCSATGSAAIFKCIDGKGKINFTDQPCAQDPAKHIAQPAASKKFSAPAFSFNLPSRPNVTMSLAIIAALYALMSCVCYTVYYVDKRAAQNNGWRVPERLLHTLELLGGWPGALLAQRKLRHKCRKLSYQMVFWLIVGVHFSVWIDQLALNGVLFNNLLNFVSSKMTA